MDKEWIKENPTSKEYQNGLDFFLDYAYTKGNPRGKEILCPCTNCYNTNWLTRNEVRNHLIAFGFQKGYDVWVRHGEKKLKPGDLNDNYMNHEEDQIDDIYGLLHGRFRDVVQEENEVNVGLNEDAKKIYNLVEEAKQDLYPGCKNFSKLSFIIRLYLLKCLYGWSNISFNALLELLREAMPSLNVPDTFSKTKGKTKDHKNARLDLKEMGIKKKLHPKEVDQGKKSVFAKAWFSMTAKEKTTFCSVLKNAKIPDGCASNISRYFHSGVETRFTRITRNSDICDPHERESSSSCLNVGHPIGGKRKGEAISLDCKSSSLAHRYILFNHEDVQNFIRGKIWDDLCLLQQEMLYMDDPFVLAYQVHQCFYIQDPSDANKHYVMKSIPRDSFNMNEQSDSNLHQLYDCDISDHAVNLASNDEICEVEFGRNDIPPTIVDIFVPVSVLIESDDDSNL
ncbi:hypothetical protein KIW84_056582 [Lathyrus oleraceus]|uniref:Transposase-associated domain-containing protein n=1 Tax=Pisum sativum TaxID=3888 RepID=A0A9D4X1C8_PEA|nr:hypothetical protein KIW84_056582 [Pisum sativum]